MNDNIETGRAVASGHKQTVRVALFSSLSSGGLSASAYITVDEAERLIRDIRKAIDTMPRIACDADFGIGVAA